MASGDAAQAQPGMGIIHRNGEAHTLDDDYIDGVWMMEDGDYAIHDEELDGPDWLLLTPERITRLFKEASNHLTSAITPPTPPAPPPHP